MTLLQKLFYSMLFVVTFAGNSAHAEAASVHWSLQIGSNVSERVLDDPEAQKRHKQELKIMAQSRKRGTSVDQIMVAGYQSSPFSLGKQKSSVKCSSEQKAYCDQIDLILAEANASIDCSAVAFRRLFAGTPMMGMSGYGIDAACVKGKLKAAFTHAQLLFKNDRNLDWIAAALAINENCALDAEMPQYCDAVDFMHRTAFTADLLSELKSGPRPVQFTARSKILFGSDTVDMSEPLANQTSSEQMVWGEFWAEKMNVERNPSFKGQIVVGRRNQKMLYSYPFSGTLYDFARLEMLNRCNEINGRVVEDNSQGPGAPHVGYLDVGSEIKVYYLASCKIAEPLSR